MVQHFHGELSGLTIEQNEDSSRSSVCIRECQQYIDITDVERETGVVSQSHILKTSPFVFFILGIYQ
jgi:hypothetical protein